VLPVLAAIADVSVNTPALSSICGTTATYTVNASGIPAPVFSYLFTGATTGSGAGTGNGALFNKGTTHVVITASNTCGIVSTSFNVTVRDATKPTVTCKSATVTLVNGMASITAANITNSSFDNCGTVTFSVSKTSFTCSNLGVNNVILTATDASGNSSSCEALVTVLGEEPTSSIVSIPTSSVYTGGVSTNLYLGYGAQSTTLSVTVPASGGPYTYSWTATNNGTGMLLNAGGGTPLFTPTTAGYYTFTVTATNKFGCSSTSFINICVTDIRVIGGANDKEKKVYLCHVPPGNSGKSNTLSISVNAVAAHLTNHAGDRLGSCDQQPCKPSIPVVTSTTTTIQVVSQEPLMVKTSVEELKVTVMPNPTTTFFTLKLESKYQTPVNLRVMDGSGRVIDARSKIGANSTFQIGHNYSSGTYYAELIQGTNRKVIQLIKVRG